MRPSCVPQTIIAANMKMYKTHAEIVDYFSQYNQKKQETDKEVVFFVSPIFLPTTKALTNATLGAQNIHHKDAGAFTGETSITMVKPYCSWILVGHSERRQQAYETNEQINEKIKLAQKHHKKVMLCIGENAKERNAGKTKHILETKLKEGLIGINSLKNMAIAYEPYWAISKGDPNHKPATPEEVEIIHKTIKEILLEKYTSQEVNNVSILYGGSAKKDNATIFLAQPTIHGLLIGRASLDPEHFMSIINIT